MFDINSLNLLELHLSFKGGATECLETECPCDRVPSDRVPMRPSAMVIECPMVIEYPLTQSLSKGPPLVFFYLY